MEEESGDASVSRSCVRLAFILRLCSTDLKAIMMEAEDGKRQVHARTLDSQGSSLSASASIGMSTNTPTNVGQGAGPLRQPGPISGQRWRSDTPPTPRRVVSYSATPPNPEPLPVLTPSRTSTATRVTQATQANPGPSRPIMGPVITPVRQTQNASGSTSTGGSSRKPSCVPVLSLIELRCEVTVVFLF